MITYNTVIPFHDPNHDRTKIETILKSQFATNQIVTLNNRALVLRESTWVEQMLESHRWHLYLATIGGSWWYYDHCGRRARIMLHESKAWPQTTVISPTTLTQADLD